MLFEQYMGWIKRLYNQVNFVITNSDQRGAFLTPLTADFGFSDIVYSLLLNIYKVIRHLRQWLFFDTRSNVL